jgi:hypothetical protein
MLVLGEIRTALLRNSASVTPDVARRVLELQLGERVRCSEQPIRYAISPDLLTGVDCRLATSTGRRMRGIGTVVTHASVTGCRVLQGSTHTELAVGGGEHRKPWSHYLSRPGVVEVATRKARPDDIRAGFLERDLPDALDLGAVSERTMDGIQRRPELDRAPPFVARRIALRWTFRALDQPADNEQAAGATLQAHFRVINPAVRTVEVTAPSTLQIPIPAVVGLCEDLALHDWLLTTLLELIERGQRTGNGPNQVVENLRPAVEHLIHLWFPGAHVDEALLPIWSGFDRDPGFSRQWEVSVNRIRDQIAVTTARLLGAVPAATVSKPDRPAAAVPPGPQGW